MISHHLSADMNPWVILVHQKRDPYFTRLMKSSLYMGVSKNREYPKMDGLKWKTLWTNGWFGGKTHYFRKHLYLASIHHPPTTWVGSSDRRLWWGWKLPSIPYVSGARQVYEKMSDFSDLFPSRMFLGGFVEIRMAEYFGGWEKKHHIPSTQKMEGVFQ